MDALLPLIRHAHVLSCQLPRLSRWMSTTEIYSQKCNCHGQDGKGLDSCGQIQPLQPGSGPVATSCFIRTRLQWAVFQTAL